MIDISVSSLVKSFELGKNILDGLTFTVNSGERVGILGHNGCGKTTLFRILAGEIGWDEGEVMVASSKRLGLISQIPVYPDGWTTEDVLRSAHKRLYEISDRLDELGLLMEHDQSPALLQEYDRLSDDFRRLGGYDMDTARNRVANGLDIPAAMREQAFDSLSGGEKTRVNLARLILEDTDILLLDEPTNHLDLRATEWLEDYLLHFKGTVLSISHDRWFIDRVAQRCIEIVDGKAEFYSGGYSFYLEERQRRFEEKMRKYEKDQAKIEQLTRAAEQMHLWAFMGNDKLHKRAFSMEKRIEKLSHTEKPTEQKKLSVKFRQREFEGDEVLVMEGLSKSFGEKKLFSDLDLTVTGGERIALIGDNGTGKSTLLRCITGEETPDRGWIHLGPAVKSAYLPQLVRFDDPSRNMVDTMLWEAKCDPQTARNRLAAFGFRGEDVFKTVSVLSGGEQSRLRLCILMRDDINFLMLDEPTNHLDLLSREWMEDALMDYSEALLFVSHDRWFIEKFATRIWCLHDGQIEDYRGGFAEWREYKARQEALQPPAKAAKSAAREEKPKKKTEPNRDRRRQRIERDIERAEASLRDIEAEMEKNASDYQKLLELGAQKDAAEESLETLYAEWETLAE